MSQGIAPKFNNHYFANGWAKESKAGESYISAKVGNAKSQVKMWVSINGAEPQEIEYFAVINNKPRVDRDTGELMPVNPNAPAYSFSFSTKE